MHFSTYLSLTQVDFWSGVNLPADQVWWSAIRKWKHGGSDGSGGGGGRAVQQQSWAEWAAEEEEAAASKDQLA